jgi:hypothetical protein
MNPVDVSSPRVSHTLPNNIVIPLTPHPAAENDPYVPQGMAGMNLFDTFEEEHIETPSLPRYNTRYRARQHSANQDQFLAPLFSAPLHSQIIKVMMYPPYTPLIIFLWPML